MKKHLFFALAAFGMVACMQDEIVTVQQDAISFQGAFVENATRAAADPSTTEKSIEGFNVWGFMDQPSGYVFTGDEVVKAGGLWTYEETQYWAPNHTYYFAAVSPIGGNWALSGVANTYGPGTLSFTNVDGSEDLLYAATSVNTPKYDDLKADGMDAVKLQFSHLLSKVKFTFKNGFLTDNMSLEVKDIKMTAPATGTIDLAVENWWDNDDWQPAGDLTLEFGNVAKLLATKSDECAHERLTIPVDKNYEYEVTFTVKLYTGDQLALEDTKTTTISGVALEMGKAYNFSAEINPENLHLPSIEFEVVEVKDWVNAATPDAQVWESELKAAALLGGSYTLPGDVTLTSPIVVPAGSHFVLNLNGYTVKNQVENAATDVIVVEEGGELVINGEGTVEAVTGNDGYAVIAKGKVTINGGTYKAGVDENGEANAVVYARGNGEVYVNGGYFPNEHSSVYVLNKKDADRATTVIEVRGGTFVGFNPADNAAEGAGTNFVAEGYFASEDGDNYIVRQGALVSNKDELINVAENTTINPIYLGANIDMGTNSFVLTRDLYIDMNGKEYKAYSGNGKGNYSFNLNNHSLTIDNAKMTTEGFSVTYDSKLTFNSGSIYYVSSKNSRNLFYVASNDARQAVVTINGGDFSINTVHQDRVRYVAAQGNAVVYINGGNFGVPGEYTPFDISSLNGYTGQVIISGGTFKFDPCSYGATIADGCTCNESNGVWTVSAN